MSYEVTATRRRPQAFEALAGQEFVAETLRNAIQSQKIAHAYLFSGPRGCGKTSTARILAKALNCANGPTATPCGKCQQCLEITKGASTDVIEIDGASNTSVNDVRQIKDEVLFPPQSSRYKIYIIDEVHMLSTSAFNALLKTIEEPPPYCIFIFATTELQKVPATIKSRCQQFNFRLVPIERVKQLLAEAAAEINIKADDEALYWVARESTGSVRDAYTLFDQVAAFSGDHITYDKIRDKLGLVGVDRLNAVFEDAAQNKSQEVLLKIDEFLQNGVSIEQFTVNCTDYLRSLLLIKAGITKEALLGQSRERFSPIVLQTWNPIQIERALSILLQLYRDIRYSLSPRYELELAFSRLSWLSQYVSPSEVKRAIDDAKNLLMQGAKLSGTEQNRQNPPSAAMPNAQERQFIQMPPNSAQQSSPAQNSQSQNPAAPQTQASNPYLNRVITNVPGDAEPKAAPRNIFAPPPENPAPAMSTGAAQFSPPPAQSVPTAAAQFSPQAEQDVPADFTEDFAPPDPTPQSFSQGGAVPPQQTAAQTESDFRELAIKEISMRDPMLASSLYQTGAWIKNGNVFSTQVSSGYLKMQIDSHIRDINSYLSSILGQQVSFQVALKQVVNVPVEQNAPVQVKILCDLFKGQIVGHSKKTEQEIAAEAAQLNAEKAAVVSGGEEDEE
ncbi:DNA polymerase III subunit gamma/tau [uncultured Treponema sp.]|uniref:DNA polymerase III subunit gamma/tau n=1 Tax=uncultured Treponema sp. TaxID=162155 RepID=UPI0025D1B246|nr:DNA polymerase III subunit gamma/tau [uncultured Treponema sp.]